MKLLYTFLFLAVFSSIAVGQISINPNSMAITMSEDGDHLYTFTISNAGATDVKVWWKLVKGAGYPSAWSTQTCDSWTCYAPDLDECPSNKGNVIAANSTTTFTVHFYPNSVSGTSKMHMQLYSDKNFNNLIVETDPDANIIADKTLGVKSNTGSGDLKLFPNPADDYFTIKNDNGVSKVGIFNIVGKEIRSYRHSAGNSYDVSDLIRGVYIVRLMDAKSKTLKSIRLSKR